MEPVIVLQQVLLLINAFTLIGKQVGGKNDFVILINLIIAVNYVTEGVLVIMVILIILVGLEPGHKST
jgi:hypothetical protein